MVKAFKNTLPVETENEIQLNKVLEIKEIANVAVVVEPHKTLNQIKGRVRSKTLGMNTIDELRDRLRDQDVAN